jgi:uncharacterized protein (TIGR00730 family)
MKSICVFCSSNIGSKPEYITIAKELGKLLAEQQITLIYGGANVGLMRAVAQETINHGGKAIGVITHFLAEKHLTQQGLSELILVDTMHERKAKMTELADGFITLPGGFGTLEEIFEVLTAAQLGFHKKPIAIINTDGFYEHIKLHLKQMVDSRMLLEPHANIAHFVNTPMEALDTMRSYKAPVIEKWIDAIRKENGHI